MPSAKYTQASDLLYRKFIGYLPIDQRYNLNGSLMAYFIGGIYVDTYQPGDTPQLYYSIREGQYITCGNNCFCALYKTINPAVYYFKKIATTDTEIIYTMQGIAGYSFGNEQYFNNYYIAGTELEIGNDNLLHYQFIENGDLLANALDQAMYEQVSEISIEKYGVEKTLLPVYPFYYTSDGLQVITYDSTNAIYQIKHLPGITVDELFKQTLTESITSCNLIIERISGTPIYVEINNIRYQITDADSFVNRTNPEDKLSIYDNTYENVYLDTNFATAPYPSDLL